MADCFKHHAARAQAHGANHVAVIFGSGEHDDARGKLVEIHFFQNSKTILIRHAQIQQQNVGLELGQHLDAIVAVGSFADDGDFVVAVEQFAQTFTEDGMIVSHQDTNLLFCSFGHISREEPQSSNVRHDQEWIPPSTHHQRCEFAP